MKSKGHTKRRPKPSGTRAERNVSTRYGAGARGAITALVKTVDASTLVATSHAQDHNTPESYEPYKAKTPKPINKFYATAVGNRKWMLDKIDERTYEVRRWKEIWHGLMEDLGGFGHTTLVVELLTKNLAWQFVRLEAGQVMMLNGDPGYDDVIWMAQFKTCIQAGRILGLKRVRRLVGSNVPGSPGYGEEEPDENESFEDYLERIEAQHSQLVKKKKKKKVGRPKKKKKHVVIDMEEDD